MGRRNCRGLTHCRLQSVDTTAFSRSFGPTTNISPHLQPDLDCARHILHASEPTGSYAFTHNVLTGTLIGKDGSDLPRTRVREDCQYVDTSAAGGSYPYSSCSLVVDTGSHTYTAAVGPTYASPSDMLLTSNGGERPSGTIKLTELGSSKQGATVTYTIRISAQP